MSDIQTIFRGFRQAIAIAGLVLFVLATPATHAASIPAWLDDAITAFNEKNPGIQIQFVDIKDSFVWYVVPDTAEIGSKDIRDGIYGIAQTNGYKMTTTEELVTIGRPPGKPATDKKCWQRSFTLDAGPSAAGRMLTTFVCEDNEQWFAGFRVLQ